MSRTEFGDLVEVDITADVDVQWRGGDNVAEGGEQIGAAKVEDRRSLHSDLTVLNDGPAPRPPPV